MYFSYVRAQNWSGKTKLVKSANKPWQPETNVSKDYNPVVFSVQLPPEEEGWSLEELAKKYPEKKA